MVFTISGTWRLAMGGWLSPPGSPGHLMLQDPGSWVSQFDSWTLSSGLRVHGKAIWRWGLTIF